MQGGEAAVVKGSNAKEFAGSLGDDGTSRLGGDAGPWPCQHIMVVLYDGFWYRYEVLRREPSFVTPPSRTPAGKAPFLKFQPFFLQFHPGAATAFAKLRAAQTSKLT
jgi:hypothetical protein